MKSRVRFSMFCMTVIMQLTFSLNIFAQEFPAKHISIVVGFPAGGGSGLIARIFADSIKTELGTNIIVENRPGAAGTVGTDAVVRAAPNGQTILFTPSNIAMTKAIYRKLPFDPQVDLKPVALTTSIPFVLVVHPSLPVKNVSDFVALAKRRPGALDYGSSGPGSPPYFAMELLNNRAKVDIHHVPYQGAGPITVGVMSGEVQTAFLIPPLAMPHMQSGRMRGLAVSARVRSSALPDLPTLTEAGIPGYEITQWHAFFAPSKTPAPIINKLNAAIVKSLASPDLKIRLAAQGADLVGSTPQELALHLASEIKSYSELAQQLNLTLK